jgi:hypothetical protein
MPEIGTSGLMSGEGKRSAYAKPRLSSTLPVSDLYKAAAQSAPDCLLEAAPQLGMTVATGGRGNVRVRAFTGKSQHPGLHGCRTQHRAVGSAPLYGQMSS